MLNVKDKKIMRELILNSRMPITQLSKKCGISREVALYRINKLNRKIIRGYYTIIDFKKIGYKRHICFLQLKGITLREEHEFLEYLNEHRFVTYMGPIIGKWNAVFDIVVLDEEHLKKIISEIKIKAGKHLESLIVNGSGIEEEIYSTKFIENKPTSLKKTSKKEHEIDKIDLKILEMLSTDSRKEYKDMSENLKMSANAIKYRIKAMEKAGIIKGYTISIDYGELGLQFYNFQLKINHEIETKLKSYIRSHKRMIFFYKYLGQESWDIDIGIIVSDSEELRNIILELKNIFGEHLKIHDIYVISHVMKDNVAPKGIFS